MELAKKGKQQTFNGVMECFCQASFNSLKQNYAVGLFPEGDNTFYGETLDIYKSTGKLITRNRKIQNY